MKFNLLHILLCCISLSVLNTACNDDRESKIPDVSNIDPDGFSFTRYDREIMALDIQNLEHSYNELLKRQPFITEIYFEKLLSIPSENKDSFLLQVKNLLQAESIIRLQDTIDHVFMNTTQIEKELETGCKFLKYYFPGYKTPHFYAYHTEFGYQAIIFSDGERDGIGLGLDYFLGEDFDYKRIDSRNPVFSEYMIRMYNKDHIARRAFDVIVEDLVGDPGGKRFIDLMIHEGKKIYILDQLLPHVHDTVISGFSSKQFDWLNENELEIWSFFIDKDMFYNTNMINNMKYLSPAPNSPGMPKEAPGRTASYIGWKIVKAFMIQNPDFNMQDLVKYRDAQKLMELSRYRPPRR